MVTHNILTLWPRGWNEPIECLEEVLNGKLCHSRPYNFINLYSENIECRLVKSVGINSPMPTYVIAVFDQDKNYLSHSLGESPYLASLDACRVALQNVLNYRP